MKRIHKLFAVGASVAAGLGGGVIAYEAYQHQTHEPAFWACGETVEECNTSGQTVVQSEAWKQWSDDFSKRFIEVIGGSALTGLGLAGLYIIATQDTFEDMMELGRLRLEGAQASHERQMAQQERDMRLLDLVAEGLQQTIQQ